MIVCDINDLMPCGGDNSSNCKSGYKHDCHTCTNQECEYYWRDDDYYGDEECFENSIYDDYKVKSIDIHGTEDCSNENF